MISILVVLWLIGLVIIISVPMIIFYKTREKKQNKINKLYDQSGIKANADIIKKGALCFIYKRKWCKICIGSLF